MTDFQPIVSQFLLEGEVERISPLGNGLINDTFLVTTVGGSAPDYVLQRINDQVFQDVPLLQRNIEAVTAHIRRKLQQRGEGDLDRRVLRFVRTRRGETFCRSMAGDYWRMSVFIPRAVTCESVTPAHSREAGEAFGDFERMLTDLPERLGETIPDFHNMELRARQLDEAVQADRAGRLAGVRDIVSDLGRDMQAMCLAERLHREGRLPKRACHCDTKVNNMMFDADTGRVLCVIDLDTVMPSYVFSDYGDFLRTAANAVAEDDPDTSRVAFRHDIFEAFTWGYLGATRPFLTPAELDHLPYGVALFPFMQCARFLTDYLNGDTYYKTKYPAHNLDRARNQQALYHRVADDYDYMDNFIKQL